MERIVESGLRSHPCEGRMIEKRCQVTFLQLSKNLLSHGSQTLGMPLSGGSSRSSSSQPFHLHLIAKSTVIKLAFNLDVLFILPGFAYYRLALQASVVLLGAVLLYCCSFD